MKRCPTHEAKTKIGCSGTYLFSAAVWAFFKLWFALSAADSNFPCAATFNWPSFSSKGCTIKSTRSLSDKKICVLKKDQSTFKPLNQSVHKQQHLCKANKICIEDVTQKANPVSAKSCLKPKENSGENYALPALILDFDDMAVAPGHLRSEYYYYCLPFLLASQ